MFILACVLMQDAQLLCCDLTKYTNLIFACYFSEELRTNILKPNKGGLKVEDKEIIDLYWLRSEKAISETDKKYGKLCLKIAGNILKNKLDCEECLNDTYMTMWHVLPPNRPEHLGAFICRIMRNYSLKKCEFHSRKKRKSVVQSLDELNDIVPDTCSLEDMVDEKVLSSEIQDFLMAQDTLKRVVFVRRYWFCDSFSSIAEQCNISESNVKMILSRMRKNLKQYLEERGLCQ